jgi:hypothetical protein
MRVGDVFQCSSSASHSVGGRVALTGIAATVVALDWGKYRSSGTLDNLTSTRPAPLPRVHRGFRSVSFPTY